MAVWKYSIQMQFIHGEEQPIPINPENIRRLYIDNNYVDNNMPVMYTIINVDKNFFDKIVLYAKEAKILLSVYKYDDSSDAKTKLVVYNGLCEYFIRDDINYNKEIDYKGAENETRKDIYREGYLGLMFNDSIDANKQTVNNVVKNSTMMNAVASYVTRTPCLIEPFTYNDNIEQLIVPPQDSLVKTVEFFNNIKVFYDTKYRIYFDPDCLYLVSSSGKATEKVTDKYPTVRFTVHAVDDTGGFVQGMSESPDNNCYTVDVSVKDTVYNMDNDTAKIYKSIQGIINPSLENSLATQGAIQNVMNDINGITGSIGSVLKEGMGIIKSIPSSLSKIKLDFIQSTENTTASEATSQSCISKAIEAINAMPLKGSQQDTDEDGNEVEKENEISKEEKERIITGLKKCQEELKSNNSTLNKLPGDFAGQMGGVLSAIGSLTSTPSFLNCVNAINAQDNISKLMSSVSSTKSQSSTLMSNCTGILLPKIDNANALFSYTELAIKYIGESGIEPEKVKDAMSGLNDAAKVFKTEANSISINLGTYKTFPTKISDMSNNYTPYIGKLNSMKVNLKAQFTNLKSDLNVLGKEMKSKLKEITENGQKTINKLKSSGLTLSSLADIQTNIKAIKDISKIGVLGISKFSVNLDLDKDDGKGTLIYKVNNDNANLVKNIKSEIENNMYNFIVSKDNIDVSVFNINMEYIIKNYDAHSDTDGRFLLDRKVEMFAREDENFKCTTQLSFRKIADDAGGASMAKSNDIITGNANYAQAAETIVKNATDLFKSIKENGFDLKSITKASIQIKNIEDAYKSMSSSHNKANIDIMKTTGCFGQLKKN